MKSYAVLVPPLETTSKSEEKSYCVAVAISFYSFPEVFLVSEISFDLHCQKHSLDFIQIFIKWIFSIFDLAWFCVFWDHISVFYREHCNFA